MLFALIESKSWVVIRGRFKNAFFSYLDWVLEPLVYMKFLSRNVKGRQR